MRLLPAAMAVATSLLFATTAHAQLSHNALHDAHGPEIGVAVGVGGFTNDSSTAFTTRQRANDHMYWAGPEVEGGFSGRLTRWLSLGARLHYQYSAARDLPAGTTGGHMDVVSGGPFVRVYIGEAAHWDHINPWFGVGIEPSSNLWAHHSTPAGDITTRVTAFSVPIHTGVEWNFTQVVSAGLMASVAPWMPYETCSSVQPNGDLLCTGNGTAPNTYVSVSANLRLQLPW